MAAGSPSTTIFTAQSNTRPLVASPSWGGWVTDIQWTRWSCQRATPWRPMRRQLGVAFASTSAGSAAVLPKRLRLSHVAGERRFSSTEPSVPTRRYGSSS